ncbi:MAG: hypothetical protein AB2L20_25505 [Mangrovibacterium sp.]
MRKFAVFHCLVVTIVLLAWLYQKYGHVRWFIYVLMILLGFIYVWGFERTLLRAMKQFQNSQLEDGSADLEETVLARTGMNRLSSIFAEGGTGYLLQDKLIFIPHKLNLSKERVTVLFTDVRSASGYKVFGIVDVGLKITLKSGKEEKFIVDKSGEFFRLLMANLR